MITKLREESIYRIFEKYELEPSHARQVCKLSLIIFDKTREILHSLGDNERDILEAAALLHDIGYYISAKAHNKNSYKLIEKEKMPGFSEVEKEIIGNIARYHRGKLPKKSHSRYNRLSGSEKSIINKLAAFLRLADAFDRSHCNVIKDIDFIYDSFCQNLTAILMLNIPYCSAEIIKAKDKKDLFEKEFSINLKFEITKLY